MLVLIGSFFGGLLYALRGSVDGDTAKRDVVVEKKLTDLSLKVDEIREELESLRSLIAENDRDSKRAVQSVSRKVDALDNQEIEDMRYEEIMKILRFFEKKWKR